MNELVKGKSVALIICTYNRPTYLYQCMASVRQLSPQPTNIIIVDDASTDEATLHMVNSYETTFRAIHEENTGIKDSIKDGVGISLALGSDLMIVLDGDAIVKPNMITRLVDSHEKHGNICSGFNTHNIKNPIEATGDGVVFKKHVNGINVCFNKEQYERYIAPSLEKVGNWDYNTSLAYQADNNLFTITAPSVVQHIGLVSSMGHTNNGVKPDTAYDFD